MISTRGPSHFVALYSVFCWLAGSVFCEDFPNNDTSPLALELVQIFSTCYETLLNTFPLYVAAVYYAEKGMRPICDKKLENIWPLSKKTLPLHRIWDNAPLAMARKGRYGSVGRAIHS